MKVSLSKSILDVQFFVKSDSQWCGHDQKIATNCPSKTICLLVCHAHHNRYQQKISKEELFNTDV